MKHNYDKLTNLILEGLGGYQPITLPYSFNDLEPHIDRKSCEFSTTLNLGGDPWPIYLEPNNEINLKPGDMLIYKGCEVKHWRKPFKGELCVQTFLHYNKINGIKYDGRDHLGLPHYTKIYK